MATVLVTGASGWIGQALCRSLVLRGHAVLGVTRRPGTLPAGVTELHCPADDFVGLADAWPAAQRADTVIHLAARVHVMHENDADLQSKYRISNCEASVRVARLALERGARRFVFMSSIKALGEHDWGVPLREDSTAHPVDAYGASKHEAELALRRIAGLELVIVRVPLVYGPAVRANFRRMLDVVARGWPLPLACVRAHRSLVALDNLTDALERCATDPRAVGEVFHVADRESPTIPELLRELGHVLERRVHLLPVPLVALRWAAELFGQREELLRLTSSLCVDTSHITARLGWRPPLSMREALIQTARWYRSEA